MAGQRRLLAVLVSAPLLVLTSCGGPTELPTYRLDPGATTACEDFVADLPDTLAGEERGEVEPADALGAAYGDPAITVVCGGPAPASFNPASQCDEVDGVGWYLSPDATTELEADVVAATPANEPLVEVVVPGEYRPGDDTIGDDVVAAALASLAPLVRDHLTQLDTCD